jgi:hypothetical protein
MAAETVLTERSILAKELGLAFREQRPPFFPTGNCEGWSKAVQEVMVRGDLECAIFAARHVSAAFPASEYLRNLCAVFDSLPPLDDRLLPFRDDLNENVQVVARPDTDTVMMLFSGWPHLLGLPLCVVHRWLGRLPANLIYLSDVRNLVFQGGVSPLGKDRAATIAALREMIASLGGRRLVCYGDSGGAFAALHYGLELGAEAVLATGARTNLANLRRARDDNSLHPESSDVAIDLRELFRASPRPPRTLLVYAEHNWDDRLHALHLASLSGVTLRKVTKYSRHVVVPELMRRGEFQSLLDWLIAG